VARPLRTLRPLLAALAVCVPLLAGCMGSDAPAPGPRYASDDELASAAPFTILLCRGGARLAHDVTDGLGECNHRVTKPLLDGTRFDWQDQHGPANEVSVSVDPTNPLHVAGGAKDYTVSYLSGFGETPCGRYTVWMGTYWSRDGGVTWGNDLMPGFPGDPRLSPLTGNLCNTDPVVVFGDDGTLFYSGLNYDGTRAGSPSQGIPENPLYPGSHDLVTGSQLYVARSHDGGATYPPDEIAFCGAGDDGVQFNDKQWFAVGPGSRHVILTWTPFYSSPPVPGTPVPLPPEVGGRLGQWANYISYCESFDGGQTWGPQRLFTPGNATPVDSQFSMPAFLPRGGETDVAVIWAEMMDSALPAEANASLPVRVAYTEGRRAAGGTVFAPALSGFTINPVKAGPDRDGTGPSFFRVSSYPVLAVDATSGEHSGRRYVVWADQPGPGDSDVDVLLRHSDDGRTWSAPVRFNDDPRTPEPHDQIMPWIAVDPRGGVHVAWADRRNDPENRLLDIYYAYSADGGATFAPNVRVSERSFDGDLGHHQSGGPFIGDYIGLSATEVSAVVFWADTRHADEPGRQHTWPGSDSPVRGSDVYSATILRDAGAARVFVAAQS
jgi:hypothetical protein